MTLSSLPSKILALVLSLLLAACGGTGSSASPPAGGITVTPGNGQVTITWQPQTNVQYWLLYAATATSIDMSHPSTGHMWATNISSPYVITGLTNGVTYSFAMNARTDGGPGGAQTPSVSAVPRMAGASWSPGTGSGSSNLAGLAYGAASDASLNYVAAGDAGMVYKSTDGVGWSSAATALGVDFRAALYALGQFFVVGANGTNNVLHSTDLATWTGATTAVSVPLNALASDGTSVVAVGDAGQIRVSTNGNSWNAATVPGGFTANLYGVAYGASGRWIAVGQAGALLTSTDGLNWTAGVSGVSGSDLTGVAVTAGGVYMAVGRGGAVTKSSDGVTWTAQTLTPATDLLAVNADASQFLVVGAAGTAWTSPDGLTWTSRTAATGIGSDLRALRGSPSLYIAVGNAGATISSR